MTTVSYDAGGGVTLRLEFSRPNGQRGTLYEVGARGHELRLGSGYSRASAERLARRMRAETEGSTTNGREQTMANTATQKKQEQKPKEKPLTLAQARKVMEQNKSAYDKYQVDRGKGVKRSENKHAAGYKAYKSAYRRVLELTKDERAAKKAKREAARAEAQAPAGSEPPAAPEGTGK